MVDAEAAAFFRQQQEEDPENNACFDSGTAAPQWASISHGIYISIEASGAHRSLGVRTSNVQSTTMDSWKPLHLRMMELGGNRRFREFLREHGVPEDLPIRQKYTTRAAEWYRENLLASAQGSKPPAPLAKGTGHLPASGTASPEQQMLDKVFAAVPLGGAMTSGGVRLAARGNSEREPGRRGQQAHEEAEALQPGVSQADVRRRPGRREARELPDEDEDGLWELHHHHRCGGGELPARAPAAPQRAGAMAGGFQAIPSGSSAAHASGCGAPPLWCVAASCLLPFCRRSCSCRCRT